MKRFCFVIGFSALLLLACTGVQGSRAVTVATQRIKQEHETYTYNAMIPEVHGLKNGATEQLINERLKVMAERQKKMFQRDVAVLVAHTGSTVKSAMTITYKVARADNNVVSIMYVMSPYMSGASHPNHFTRSFNYDVAARKEFSLEQLFSNNSYLQTLSSIASEKLTSQSHTAGTYYDGKEALIKEGTRPSVNTFRSYNIGNGSITFHFDPYEVGSYAEGIQHVTLSGAVLEGQLSEMGQRFLLQ